MRHPETKYSRVVLVRDQVLKLGCNHFIFPNINIQKMEGKPQFVRYYVSRDYALEEETEPMTIVLKFNSEEIRDKFYELFKSKQEEEEERTQYLIRSSLRKLRWIM